MCFMLCCLGQVMGCCVGWCIWIIICDEVCLQVLLLCWIEQVLVVFFYCCQFVGGQVYEWFEVFGKYVVWIDMELGFVGYGVFWCMWLWLGVEYVVVDQV